MSSSTDLFCLPNTTLSARPSRLEAAGVRGFGCGRGVCHSSGQFCVCEPGYAHSNYFLYLGDCWETSRTRTAVMVANSLIIMAVAAFCAYQGWRARARVRYFYWGAMFCNLSLVASNLTMYLEGFNGIASAIIFCASIWWGLRVTGQIVWMFLQPSLRMSGSSFTKRGELVLSFIVPSLVFYTYFSPQAAAYAALERPSFIAYNQRVAIFFLFSGIMPIFFGILPLSLSLVLFNKVFNSKSSEVAQQQQQQPSQGDKASAPAPSQLGISRAEALNRQLRRFTLWSLLLFGVPGAVSVLIGCSVLLSGQSPMQAVLFFILKLYGVGFAYVVHSFVTRTTEALRHDYQGGGAVVVHSGSSKRSNKSKEDVAIGTVDISTSPESHQGQIPTNPAKE